MNFQALHDHLRAIDAPGFERAEEARPADKKAKDPGRAGQPFVVVDSERWIEFLTLCRDDKRLAFELLIDITATDPKADDPNLWINVELLSVAHKHRLSIKAFLPKEKPVIASATAVYRAAQWHERECAEMFGITFAGHPDPRNILLPDDWVGHPMRKDYEFPKEYHGISCE